MLILRKVGSLDDVKTNQSDIGAARSVALDHLGVIASRLRSASVKFGKSSATGCSGKRALKPMEEVPCPLPLAWDPTHHPQDLLQPEYL
jgi:cohesin loading factor subunit SCC2